MASQFENDRATTTVELGPRSLAVLRRIELALETLIGQRVEDPGKGTEDDSQGNV